MLAIREQKGKVRDSVPNILPCKIHYNGQVNASSRHWDPQQGEDGKQLAYFRGRKLHGHTVKLPQGYQGVVAEKTDNVLPPTTQTSSTENDDVDEDEEVAEDVRILSQTAFFDHIIVWGHEAVPAAAEDAYIKGVDEWTAFAQAMNSYDHETKQ